ncbi:hypothetical protein F5Y19DRAFT_157018 [Xylariaceae sp. FL1651]|nr:hypothetical protein F5Y19DRAFT_157018 [Xylariaceae sp. FL1651]
MTPAIAIIGGGPCGLTLARLLERKGIDYVVYERNENESSTQAGGSLDLHVETGQRAVREAGLFEEFKKHARWDDGVLSFCDKEGKKLVELGQERDLPEIDRRELRHLLLESVPKEKIHWGHALKSATLGENGSPVLEFTNGFKCSGFKLVVGADGAWSKLRSLVTDARPQYYGVHYIESKIYHGSPAYEAVSSKVKRGTMVAIGSGKAMLIQRQGDGHYRMYFAVPVHEDFARSGIVDLSNVEATRAMFLSPEYYSDWAEDFKNIIQHSVDFYSWPLYNTLPETVKWKHVPGVTLAGDAAHTSTPFAGEGVNCAMTDAWALASKIAAYGTEGLDRAVREYEEEMFTRGVDLITRSARNGELIFHKEGPEAMLRAVEGGLFKARVDNNGQ